MRKEDIDPNEVIEVTKKPKIYKEEINRLFKGELGKSPGGGRAARRVVVFDIKPTETRSSEIKRVFYEPPLKEIYHTVKKGETIWKIAKKYGVGVNEIIKDNNLPQSPDGYVKIVPGQKLRITVEKEASVNTKTKIFEKVYKSLK